MNFAALDYRQVLVESAWSEYEKRINYLHLEQLVPLNINLYLAEKIISFPFDLFFGREDYFFFRVVVGNIYQVSLLTITRVTEVSKPDSLLPFKNWVLTQLKDEYRKPFKQVLRENRFDVQTKDLLHRAVNLRNARYAHIDMNYSSFDRDWLSFGELRNLSDILNSLISVVSFNVERLMVPINYHRSVIHPLGSDNRNDIERLLESYVRTSYLLNMPEQNPLRWEHHRSSLTDEILAVINFYRGKFGLTQA